MREKTLFLLCVLPVQISTCVSTTTITSVPKSRVTKEMAVYIQWTLIYNRVTNLLNTSKFDLRPLQWLRLVAHAIYLTWIHIWKANLQRLRKSSLVKMSVARMQTSPTLILWRARLPICGLLFLRYFCSWGCSETFWTCSFCEECILRRTPHWFCYFFSVLRT